MIIQPLFLLFLFSRIFEQLNCFPGKILTTYGEKLKKKKGLKGSKTRKFSLFHKYWTDMFTFIVADSAHYFCLSTSFENILLGFSVVILTAGVGPWLYALLDLPYFLGKRVGEWIHKKKKKKKGLSSEILKCVRQ